MLDAICVMVLAVPGTRYCMSKRGLRSEEATRHETALQIQHKILEYKYYRLQELPINL
jgi:hypothetical protein